jgi:hypothetical protein
MRGKQRKCNLSLGQLRLVPKVGQRAQLKLQQEIRKNDFTKGLQLDRYKEMKQLSTQ